ncbi:MAG: alkaline phosphatase family protein [Anaerolineae bacterium]|nr:alkaline phosphatase family protein [Anaerolineae bacterium]
MSEELAQQLAAEIRAATPLLDVDCAWKNEIVWPQYGGLSINNVPASVAAMFGAALAPGAGALPLDVRLGLQDIRASRVIQVLLDGLGYNLLQDLHAEPGFGSTIDELVGDGLLAPLTSVFPSTTAVALNSLWTGASPAAHGVLGTRMFLREYGVLMSPLSLALVFGGGTLAQSGFDPAQMVPVPGMAEVFNKAGIKTYLLTLKHLAGSGLSRMLHRGVHNTNIQGVTTFEDLWATLDEVMRMTERQRCNISVYWGGLDSVSHHAGARSRRALTEARAQLRRLRDFAQRWRGRADGAVLMVLSDHGHLDTHVEVDTANHAALSDTFRLPFAAEGRARALFLRSGMRAPAEAYLRERFANSMALIDAQEALGAGLFGGGPVHAETPARIGDLLVLCRAGTALYDPLDHYRYKSQHGGLDADEMLVPLIVRKL